MKKFLQCQSNIITIGLAIFAMLFGAGNLIFPLKVGLLAGQKITLAMFGFVLTGVLIPLMGLIALILFDGDYKAFFYRIGIIPGNIAMLLCMLVIGPFIAMPRIVTLSHIMIAPFLWNISLVPFALLFIFLTFLGTYKENNLLNLLGTIISPLKLISLGIIIIKGLFFTSETLLPSALNNSQLFWMSLKSGFNTLDLLATFFFSSMVITILKRTCFTSDSKQSVHQLALVALKAGLIGVGILALIYVCMGYLGALHGHGLEHLNQGELLSAISIRVLGASGAIIIALAVFIACYATIVALAAVVAEYVNRISKNKISYVSGLVMVLILTLFTSVLGLTAILDYSLPIIEIGYPVLITITVCNILYKLVGFTPIKIPALITLILSAIIYFI